MNNNTLNIQGKLGEDIRKIYLEALANGQIQKIYCENTDGKVTVVDCANADNKTISDTLKSIGATGANKGTSWFVNTKEQIPANIITASEVEENLDLGLNNEVEEPVEVVGEVKYDENKVGGIVWNAKKIAIAAGTFITASAITAGAMNLQGCDLFKKNKEATITTTVDEEVPTVLDELANQNTANEEITELDLEGKDWAFYTENAADSIQKNYATAIHDFTMSFNRSEDWMYSQITPEMKEDLAAAGLEIDGDEAIFGYTAEEVNALRILYSNYTNEELAAIRNGEYIDTVGMVNSSESMLNRAFRKIQLTYWNTDNQYNPIVDLCGFNEQEIERIHHYEELLFQYKNLLKEGKDKEAEELMRQIRDDIYAYGYASNDGQDKAKPFILKTLLPTFNVYSQMNQYKADVTLHLYNGVTNDYEDKTVNTMLFDEIMMRDLIEGYQGCMVDGEELIESFDAVEYLKKFNIDTKKYTIVISDDGISKADQFNSELVDKLDSYNEFITNLRTENAAADAAYTENSVKPLENNSALDELTKDSCDIHQIMEIINDDLELNNKYPKNTSFFSSKYSKFVQEFMIKKGILDSEGNYVQGKPVVRIIYIPGSYTVRTVTHTWTESYTERFTVKEKVSKEELAKEDAAKKKKAIEQASKTKVTDGDTGKDKDTTYQDIYNKYWNDNTDQSKQKTNLDDNDKIKDNDEIAKKVKKAAEEDAEDNKKQNEEAAKDAKEKFTDDEGNNHYISGGDEHKDDQYQDADTATEDEAERYNREHGISSDSSSDDYSSSSSSSDDSSSYGETNPFEEEGFAPVMLESSESEIDEEIGRSL